MHPNFRLMNSCQQHSLTNSIRTQITEESASLSTDQCLQYQSAFRSSRVTFRINILPALSYVIKTLFGTSTTGMLVTRMRMHTNKQTPQSKRAVKNLFSYYIFVRKSITRLTRPCVRNYDSIACEKASMSRS